MLLEKMLQKLQRKAAECGEITLVLFSKQAEASDVFLLLFFGGKKKMHTYM